LNISSTYRQPPDPERRNRRCLPCGRMFASEHAGNRICPKCKQREGRGLERRNVDAETVMYGGVRKRSSGV